MTKVCHTCKQEKRADRTKASEFGWRKDRRRYHAECKACRAAYTANNQKGRVTKAENEERSAIAENPAGYFIGMIIKQAKKDEDMDFLESEWYVELCDTVGWDANRIREIEVT